MQLDELGVVERKALGALMVLAGGDKVVVVTSAELAQAMGYKKTGGAVSSALKILEKDGIIKKIGNRTYMLLI